MELIVVFRMNINYRIIVINTRSTYRYNSLKYGRLRQPNTYTGPTGLFISIDFKKNHELPVASLIFVT